MAFLLKIGRHIPSTRVIKRLIVIYHGFRRFVAYWSSLVFFYIFSFYISTLSSFFFQILCFCYSNFITLLSFKNILNQFPPIWFCFIRRSGFIGQQVSAAWCPICLSLFPMFSIWRFFLYLQIHIGKTCHLDFCWRLQWFGYKLMFVHL